MPCLSVIIPCYNCESYINETIQSVIDQELEDIEIVCVDDSSNDDTLSILNSWAKRERRCKVIHFRENKGVSAARNAGVEVSSGEYIYYLDSDDIIVDPNVLMRVCQMMSNEKLDIVVGGAKTFFESEALAKRFLYFSKRYQINHDYPYVLTGIKALDALKENSDWAVTPGTRLLRRSFLADHNIKFTEGYIHEDGFYTLKTLFLADRVRIVKDQLYGRRIRANSIMTRRPDHRNVLGYIEGMIDSVRFLDPYFEIGKVSYWAWKTVIMMKKLAIKNYRKLDRAERDHLGVAMNMEQRLYFQTFIEPEAAPNIRSIVKSMTYKVFHRW